MKKKMSITDIIDKKDRGYAGKTAPAHGLFFLGPKYKDEFDIDTFELNILDRLKY